MLNRVSIFSLFLLFIACLCPLSAAGANDVVAPVEDATDASGGRPVGASLPEDTAVDNVTTNNATAAIEDIVVPAGGFKVYVVPIKGPIERTQVFILRRALKEAIANNVDAVVIEMDTPGGGLGTMEEMMDVWYNYEGESITFINDDAGSAGAYIAMSSDSIYMSPDARIGASDMITATGEDVPGTLKKKIESFLYAKVRTMTDDYRYRADLLKAMSNDEYVLKVDGIVLKPSGELLVLNAKEAVKEYGTPPEPLLASAIVDTSKELLDLRYGPGNYTVREFEITWSDKTAKWFSAIAPLLFGIGIVIIMIELKTPQFGLIGGVGIALVLVAFTGNYFAGLAGYEPVLLFFLGVLLILLEIFFFPGLIFMILLGLACVLSSLIWSMADIWPTPDGGFTISAQALSDAFLSGVYSLLVACVGILIIWRFLPNSSVFQRYVSTGAIGGVSVVDSGGGSSSSGQTSLPDLGAHGTVIKDLRPGGVIEIDGQQYQAKSAHGQIARGQHVIVTRHETFGLVVEQRQTP